MLAPFDPARATWQSISDEFNRTHRDIRFRIIWSDITRKMSLLVTAKAVPDLVIMPDFWLVQYHGILLDMDAFFDSMPEVRTQIYPELLKACEYEGKLKTIPLYYNVPFVFYRPDLFRKAGLPMPDANWTWQDYRRDAKALTQRDSSGSVQMFGTNVQIIWWVEWLSLIRQAGGDLMDAAGNLKIGAPGTRDAVEFLHDLIYADASAPGLNDIPAGGFLSGKYAMYYGGHVMELGALRKRSPFEWDIAPLPAGPAGKATGELAVGGIGIWKETKQRDVAMEVIRFLMQDQAGKALCETGLIPVRRDIARDVLLAGTPETRSAPRHPEVLVDSLSFASSLPKLVDSNVLALNCITPAITQALRNPDRSSLAGLPQRMESEARDFLATLRQKPRANPASFVAQVLVLGGILVWLVARFLKRSPHIYGEAHSKKYFFMFAAPCLVSLCVFTLCPLAMSFWWAQTDFNLVEPAHFVGLAQYRALLFHDPDFWHSLRLSLVYAVFAVPLSLVVSLSAALLLNQELRWMGAFRTIFYLPAILPVAASSLVWIWFLHPSYGVVNRLLSIVGIHGPGWLQDPHWALTALVIVSVWNFGAPMLIFLAGLKNIPQALYEAAEIDGAGALSRFRHITIPSLSPVLFFNLTMGIIGALQVFDVAYIISTAAGGDYAIGGPQKATYFYVLNLYEKSFVQMNIGSGSAMAWLFFVVVLFITGLNFWARNLWWKKDTAA
ncbi:MAG: extracellular solute-binding protein [Chthoniobacteraceae bacterium]